MSGKRSKGTYKMYRTDEERQARQKAGSKDTNDEEALLAISHKETQ